MLLIVWYHNWHLAKAQDAKYVDDTLYFVHSIILTSHCVQIWYSREEIIYDTVHWHMETLHAMIFYCTHKEHDGENGAYGQWLIHNVVKRVHLEHSVDESTDPPWSTGAAPWFHDVMEWKSFTQNGPFNRWICRSPVRSFDVLHVVSKNKPWNLNRAAGDLRHPNAQVSSLLWIYPMELARQEACTIITALLVNSISGLYFLHRYYWIYYDKIE